MTVQQHEALIRAHARSRSPLAFSAWIREVLLGALSRT